MALKDANQTISILLLFIKIESDDRNRLKPLTMALTGAVSERLYL